MAATPEASRHPGEQRQIADPEAVTGVRQPVHPPDAGPRVLFDEAHANVHRLDGRYRPFGEVLRSDGYRVEVNTEPFDSQAFAERLGETRVLVSVNATAAEPVAYRPAEIEVITTWVEEGGRLLLALDHAPFNAGRALAGAFGYDVSDAWVRTMGPCPRPEFECGSGEHVFFTVETGTLASDHPVVRGRPGLGEAVDHVVTFIGAALIPRTRPLPETDTPILVLPPRTLLMSDSRPRRNAGGQPQGVALIRGRGRVYLSGEAALFTAQIHELGGPIGFNAPGGDQNRQFLLNVLHWLDGVI